MFVKDSSVPCERKLLTWNERMEVSGTLAHPEAALFVLQKWRIVTRSGADPRYFQEEKVQLMEGLWIQHGCTCHLGCHSLWRLHTQNWRWVPWHTDSFPSIPHSLETPPLYDCVTLWKMHVDLCPIAVGRNTVGELLIRKHVRRKSSHYFRETV